MVFGPHVLRPTSECVKYSDRPWQYLISWKFSFCKNREHALHPDLLEVVLETLGRKCVFEGHPLVPFLLLDAVDSQMKALSISESWADRDCVYPWYLCVCLGSGDHLVRNSV